MPTSHPMQINEILDAVLMVNPKSILDIGVGYGKYGFLCREFLDTMKHDDNYGKRTHIIEGIEVFPKYLTPVHDYIYDKIHIGNAKDVLPKLDKKYDMILLIDVLEHFTYEDGIIILNECKRHCDYIIISVPKDIGNQGTVHGNKHETHHFQWTNQWEWIWNNTLKIKNQKSYLALCSDESMKGMLNKKKIINILDKTHLLKPASFVKRRIIK